MKNIYGYSNYSKPLTLMVERTYVKILGNVPASIYLKIGQSLPLDFSITINNLINNTINKLGQDEKHN